jgi:hypothetical protein
MRTREPSERAPRRFQLHEGEEVVLVGRPSRSVTLHKYLATLGLYGLWRNSNTFILTDRRVLIGEGIVARSERSIPLHQIEDAVYTRRGLAAYCEIVFNRRGSRRVERLGPFTPLRAHRFSNAVLART